jgi:riboflavin kinase/FMN adenylyltransferase
MKVVRFLHHLTQLEKPSAVAIGNFDGMHLGHQAILKSIQEKAQSKGWKSVVILFEPHPKEYFVPNLPPSRLMRLTDKLVFLSGLGIDTVICLKFDEKLANLSATHFIEKILIDRLKVGYLSVGEDFRFGRGRQGNVQLLRQTGLVNHFEVVTQTNVGLSESENRISSTQIRACINQGKLDEAKTLLGHPIRLVGRVTRGDQRGRTLGFPTANIRLNQKMAYTGVFTVQTTIDGQVFSGVANIGSRPTVDNTAGKTRYLEVHLFDFYGDIYGKRLSVELIDKLREETKFNSIEALKKQIAEDIKMAKRQLIR